MIKMFCMFASVASVAVLHAPQHPVSAMFGAWRGTSTCVDKKIDTACHDEVVVYDVDTTATPRGTVRMNADKIVNGARENMGVFTLSYDATSRRWFTDLSTPRVHARWSFAWKCDALEGTLRELPSNRLIREVHAKRE